MSADHAHDVVHSAPTHDLEMKWMRATSENHTERRDGPPRLPRLVLGLALTSRAWPEQMQLSTRSSSSWTATRATPLRTALSWTTTHPPTLLGIPSRLPRSVDADYDEPDLISHLAHLSPVQRATRPDAVIPDPNAHPPSNTCLMRALVVIIGKYSYDTLKKLIHQLEKQKDDFDQSYRDLEALHQSDTRRHTLIPPSFNVRYFSEECQRGVQDNLISRLRKSGAPVKAHTLANRIDGQHHIRVRDDLNSQYN
ncbi:hypothetical protein K523DRAFT_414617 [Schizophyllum commune Tattone D]|nr:hypothetical protein K525DRAFT_266700 [Schizophyllum commune Loenen D]KAI5831898.1 hypothetical protein K523DRAFT_414617 [Schizophyllum commune Tattone D]